MGFDERPSGGDAVFVMNHELRFPLYSFFDGVAFFDAGNVFDRVRDFTGLRTSSGGGLRIRTPYVIRMDYAFNLKPRPGEGRGKFYFSIGQAF